MIEEPKIIKQIRAFSKLKHPTIKSEYSKTVKHADAKLIVKYIRDLKRESI